MSLLDDASLVVVPSGYKAGTVYSVKPTNGDGDLSFTRSNDTATRVNSAGLIEKVRTNLALYSEEFDNAAYVKLFSSITANSIANPLNGATTADKIVEDTANNLHRAGQGGLAVTSGVPITFSFYAKAGERTFLEVQRINTSGTVFNPLTNNVINLSTGVIPTIGGATSSGSVSMGNGWYRYFITLTPIATGSGGLNLGLAEDISTLFYLGDGTSGAFIFGFQAETSDIATDYIPTTSSAVSVGMLANVPRLDYSGGGCPKLLLEKQSTNLVTYSEDFSEWTKSSGVIVTDNTTDLLSPSGEYNASKIEYGDSSKNLFQSPTMSGNYSGFFYVKGTEGETIHMSVGGNQQNFTLSGGWDRLKIENVTALVNTFNLNTFGGVTARTVYLWGAQIEAGSYATSYIPTLAAVSTRGADSCLKTGISSLIGQTEGVMFLDFEKTTNDIAVVQISDGTTSNRIYVGVSGTNIICQVRSGGGTAQAFFTFAATNDTRYKCAIAYKENDFVFYINGNQEGIDTSGLVPASFSQIQTSDIVASNFINPINQTLLFPTRLSNTQLAELTTL